ncbi:MAG: glycoside hydrolase family 2 protein [Chloroflexota bacterium]|nr:glycoside hydrolase family 2 protein [Chloroflexota bacterium]
MSRLTHGWKLQDFEPGAGVAAGAYMPGHFADNWLDIPVPGDVHRVLIAAGRIPDPFYDQNETVCAWMEQREWWYRLAFDDGGEPAAPDERLLLVFEGLDTFATVYLNGEALGEHHNMFRPAVFDVSASWSASQTNVIAVRFDPPLQHSAGKTLSAWGRNPERTVMRKAQFGYGWDWGPRLPTIGMWLPVELQRERRAALLGVHWATLDITADRTRAVVRVRIEAQRFHGDGPLTARVRLTRPDGGASVEAHMPIVGQGAREASGYLIVEQPQLWWTHELGQPSLYDLAVTLLDGEAELAEEHLKVGIRTLTLDQSPDPAERGTRFFRFILNGVPIFAKGADWIPCDSFVGAIEPQRYTRLIESAREANMTMLRVWGGGMYEHDHFYTECDRLGLLVWQDFMFACAMYPEDDPDFAAEIAAEARFQVRRLRSHACLALWCGNNENQWLHDRRYWDQPDPPPYGALYYDHILPEAVAELDGRTPYWPGSPYGGNDHNSREEGNVHNWEVWHGNFPRRFGEPPRREPTPHNVSFTRYAEDMGRFISEFGMHAAPVRETLRRAIPPDQLYHHSPAMDWHNKDNPKNKGDDLMVSTTGLPADLEQYITFSQIAQAEGLKFGVEHFRRRKPHCSGTLVWQLDDCWPVLSWSIIDYNGFAKASYFYLRRAYAPVLASFKAGASGGLELWVTNDTPVDVHDGASLRLSTFGGHVLEDKALEVDCPAGGSRCVFSWSAGSIGGAPDRYVWVRSSSGAFPSNRHFFGATKDLERPTAAPEMVVSTTSPHALRVRLHAPPGRYVYFAHLTSSRESTRYSDNYFDLEPGETRDVLVHDAEVGLAPEVLSLGWG